MMNNPAITPTEIKIRHYAANAVDVLEDVLDVYDIDVPSDDREGEEGEAHIYGCEYSEYEDAVTEIMGEFATKVMESDTDVNSTTVAQEILGVFNEQLGSVHIILPDAERAAEDTTPIGPKHHIEMAERLTKILDILKRDVRNNPGKQLNVYEY